MSDLLDHGLLPVAGGARIYWETSGAPDGIPALFLHGGPGSGLGSGGYRRHFDQERYRLVGIDQRGCGRSRPLVTADLGGLSGNTTTALIADIEAVRAHLDIERWLVSGISWGTTLALAYAQRHPDRVSSLVLAAVTTTSRDEVAWITEGVGRIFPEAWQAFAEASGRRGSERIVEAYARRLAGDDAVDRRRAARDWLAWEAAHVSLDAPPTGRPDDPDRDAVFATLVTHYWANDGFLRDSDAISARMDRLRAIPGVLIHGRRDVSGPAVTAWQLHRLWPGSRLCIVEGEGHGGPGINAWIRGSTDALTGAG
ncbi:MULTISPECIES: prolyl aminopeptidase [Methylobacterium]|jgi:proline iminopeptidase|uniref:prolyl aminopeptidase n=1 Tax=Methylobacterium TaxID=407 RepID=UPI0008F3D488|nr:MULTISPECIES: prolyl aminopeptidase [Methylobacterium]MBZ6415318.1 prolyl aminopeptidase [Methylobacterium sp.]MBK3396141.1 prolyl aminopeptidase [Methylobacterium ajmalii]MBK3406817.1 prolyl aminopeptidase [Methylobacterium ajmalii]MBK3425519.1 prolyl aminopeptidase [Methylobacterium ajmalii]SFE81271.1 proline iminopeptidase [Methylobacterium sp. yr596]